MMPRTDRANKAGIKGGVVRYQRGSVAAEGKKRAHRRFLVWRILDHLVRDAGQLRNARGDWHFWIGKGIEGIEDFPALYAHSTNFRDAIILRVEARGLDIENDKFTVERRILSAGDNRHHIVDEIAFHAVDHLNSRCSGGVHRLRERLRNAVIRDCNSLMPPFSSTLDKRGAVGDTIHCAHFGVQMELDALDRCIIHLLFLLDAHDGKRADRVITEVFIVADAAAHQHRHSILDGLIDLCGIFFLIKNLHRVGAGVVSDVKRDDEASAVTRLLRFIAEHVSPDCDRAVLRVEIADRRRLVAHRAAQNLPRGFEIKRQAVVHLVLAFQLIPFRFAFGGLPLCFLLRIRLLLHFHKSRRFRRNGHFAVKPDFYRNTEALLHQRAQKGVAARIF